MTARMSAVSQPKARGMIFIHSAPAALCPHLEWATVSVLGETVDGVIIIVVLVFNAIVGTIHT